MRIFRYENLGNWYKGNTHIHSTTSDGGKDFKQLGEMYAGAGYDFLFRTDHWICSDAAAEDNDEAPLLWLDGIELDGTDYSGVYYHVVCLGSFKGIERGMPFLPALEAARMQNGFLILAHPYWLSNSLEDASRYGFHAVEVYNHVCHWLNGKGHCGYIWNLMLEKDPGILAIAADDAHIRMEHPGWNGGWIMANLPELNTDSLTAALRAGNYYSTQGPEIKKLEYEPVSNRVLLECSEVQFIRLVGPASWGKRTGSFEGDLFTEADFEVPADWKYCYLELEDASGHRAWTNPLFTEVESAEESF